MYKNTSFIGMTELEDPLMCLVLRIHAKDYHGCGNYK